MAEAEAAETRMQPSGSRQEHDSTGSAGEEGLSSHPADEASQELDVPASTGARDGTDEPEERDALTEAFRLSDQGDAEGTLDALNAYVEEADNGEEKFKRECIRNYLMVQAGRTDYLTRMEEQISQSAQPAWVAVNWYSMALNLVHEPAKAIDVLD